MLFEGRKEQAFIEVLLIRVWKYKDKPRNLISRSASLVAQTIKNLSATWETWVQCLGWEDPLEEGLAAHSSILACEFLGQRSLTSCNPWGRKESDKTERLKDTLSLEDRTSQFSPVAQSCLTLFDPMDCSMQALLVYHQLWSLLKLMSIELVMPSNPLILCHPLILPPSIFPSIRVFSMSHLFDLSIP